MVILEDNPAAWQATYTAYDVAARTGANLVGVVISDTNPPEIVHRLERKFKTGARAAGIRSNFFEFSNLNQVLAYPEERDALFICRSSLTETADLNMLISNLPCSLWIIPSQRSIRKIMVMLDGIEQNAPGLNLVFSLARRWQSPLTFLGTSTGLLSNLEISDLDTVLVNESVIDQNFLLNELNTKSIDLVYLSWAWKDNSIWDTIQQSDAVFAICPFV